MSALAFQSPKADGQLSALQRRRDQCLTAQLVGIMESENFEDAIYRASREAVADANRDDAVKPLVAPRRGRETRRDAKVIAGRVDILAPADPRNDVRWAVADAGIGHGDERIVIGVQQYARVEQDGAVAADRLPVG